MKVRIVYEKLKEKMNSKRKMKSKMGLLVNIRKHRSLMQLSEVFGKMHSKSIVLKNISALTNTKELSIDLFANEFSFPDEQIFQQKRIILKKYYVNKTIK